MRLLIFAIVGAVAFMIAYAFGLGGTVSSLIFLAVLFIGVLDHWAQPMFARLRPDT